MSYEAKGSLKVVLPSQQVTEKFRKREFVLEIPGQYPEQIKFQLTQDKCELIDKFSEGDEITVHFNLRGRPYNNKNGETVYFTNLEAWRVEANSNGTRTEATPQAPDNFSFAAPTSEDNLPF